MLNNSFSQTVTVLENQTAAYVGSGGLSVFSTPSLIALIENTCMKMLSDLPEGKTTVGVSINIQHLKPSPVGATIHCSATITAIEGRKYTFQVQATDDAGNLIGTGTHERVVVDTERFMSKV